MLLKLKLFIVSLVNLGAFPFLAYSLNSLGYIYASSTDLIWLIIFAEVIFGTLLLMSIVYADPDGKESGLNHNHVNSTNPHILIHNECAPQ